jgi:hypothetical protein
VADRLDGIDDYIHRAPEQAFSRGALGSNIYADRLDMNRIPKVFVNDRHLKRQGQSGQAIIEYVLILVTVVVIATIATRELVDRSSPESGGIIIRHWNSLVAEIAADYPDRLGSATEGN